MTQELGDIARLMETLGGATERLGDSFRRIASLQEELAEKDRLLARKTRFEELGRMAAALAHEIRNPLGAVVLWTSMLKRDLEADPAKVAALDKILSAVRGLDRLVEDMLLYGRDVAPVPGPVDPAGLVEDAVAMAGLEPGIRVETLVPSGATFVADAAMLRRALLNLVLNAAQAMNGIGVLRISWAESAGRVRLAVSDSGPGFPPEVLEKLFTPFLTSKARGTGLGLALALKIAEAHRGSVSARNLPSGGAEVVLEVPR